MPETGTWTIDPAHTVVSFSVKHLMAAKVRGSFKAVSGSIEVGPNAEASSVEVTIDAASIETGAPDRDTHLRSADFLTVDEYPTLTFSSTSVSDNTDGSYSLVGDLTIKGVTKPVTLDMRYAGTINDPWGNGKAIFSAMTTIQREEWGLTWNAPLEAGGWLVGKEVTIEIEVQAAQA
jgi:polyisoprenoid-binding protein YceI